MDIRFLQSLVAVVDSGSIAGAARAQMLTAAAISQRILTLENELGCVLFSRAGHKVKPTEACGNLLPRARRLIRESQMLIEDIDVSGLSGTLRMGANSTALTGIVAGSLRGIKARAPSAKLHITPGTSIGLLQALKDDEVDVSVMVLPHSKVPKAMRYWTLRREPLLLLHHPSVEGTVREILKEQQYIRYDPLCWGGQLAERYLQNEGIVTQSMFDLDSLEAISQLVCESMGVSLIPAWAGLDVAKLGLRSKIIPGTEYQREMILMSQYHPRLPKLVDIVFNELKRQSEEEQLRMAVHYG